MNETYISRQIRLELERKLAERARKERERVRQEISFSLIAFGVTATLGVALIVTGFALPWFAASLALWIFGSVMALLFGGLLAGTVYDLAKWIRQGRS